MMSFSYLQHLSSAAGLSCLGFLGGDLFPRARPAAVSITTESVCAAPWRASSQRPLGWLRDSAGSIPARRSYSDTGRWKHAVYWIVRTIRESNLTHGVPCLSLGAEAGYPKGSVNVNTETCRRDSRERPAARNGGVIG